MRPGTADESFEGQQVRGSRISGQAVPGVYGSAGGRAQVGVYLTGGVAFQAADDLGLGFSFCCAAGDVGAGGRVGAHAGEGDPPQGVIGLAVAAGVEAVAGALARGSGDRGSGAQMRPGRLGPQPCGVVSGGDQEQGGGVGADAVQGEQAGGAGGDERDDQLVQALELAARGTARVVPARAARSGWRSRRCCRGGAAAMRSLPPGRLRCGGRTGSAGRRARSRSGTWPG